jgi:hypothetical protein
LKWGKHRFTYVNSWHSSFAPLLPLGGEGRDEGASHLVGLSFLQSTTNIEHSTSNA